MIRFFSKKDFADIYKLGDIITKNFSKTNNLEEILNDKYTKILVYENDDKVVGFLMYTALDETVDIIDIVVDEAYRNHRIASCLIDYMISELKETVKLITLEVRKSNYPAINLYEKFGFKTISTRKNYYGNEDAYVMGRESY
jgi:ribosomal-protein-alanine acetyltransferase